MKLIDLLVQELPKRGGWPAGVDAVRQNCKGQLFEIYSDYCSDFKLEKCDDWITDVVTKQQYEDALEASEGWIEWHGGKCPVDSEAIVEVKYRHPSSCQFNNDRAGDFYWPHDGLGYDIIAYRLQQPTKSERACDDAAEADDESDLNECIGQDVDTPEWNGEGLPPDGVECEVRYVFAASNWMPFRCVKSDAGVAFGWSGGDPVTAPIGKYEFRPLPGHREATRDAACDKICDAIRDAKRKTNIILTAESIYDAIAAGKIPGVKLEEK